LDDIKALLGRMMFTGSAMDKKCKVLSGGEKARLAMAKFMLAKGTPSLLALSERAAFRIAADFGRTDKPSGYSVQRNA